MIIHSGRYPWKFRWTDRLKYGVRWLRTFKIFRMKFAASIEKTDENCRLIDLSNQERHLYDFEDAICWKIVDGVMVTEGNKKVNVLTFCYYGSVLAYIRMMRLFGQKDICVLRTWDRSRYWTKMVGGR